MTSHDELDRLLRQWADEQRPGESEMKILAGRILQSLDDPTQAAEPPYALDRSHGMQRVVWFALGAAAVVLLAIGYLWFADPADEGGPNIAGPSNLPPSYVWLQEQQLRNKTVLLNEMESVFDRQVNWLAETSDRVQVDVESRSTPSEAQALAVRIVVERRHVGQPNWTVAWAIDVVARSEELVRLEPESSSDPPFTMWAYALPDGMIALDTNLDLNHLGAANATTSGVQRDGQPREVFTTEADGFEFRVFQTAAVLKDRLS